jgi:L-histidine Nalpha-methyltransferase
MSINHIGYQTYSPLIQTVLAAYDDQAGITAAFNKNLLVRANRELNADFDLDNFQHKAIFNQEEQKIEMHLHSLVEQDVLIGNSVFTIAANETIFTENCYKYDKESFMQLSTKCGWKLINTWHDTKQSNFQIFLFMANQSI